MTPKQENVFFELHCGLPREAPGSAEITARAFRIAARGDPKAGPIRPIRRILDIGCGPGAQSLVLAGLTEADIYAVDTHQPFLERLGTEAFGRGIAGRIFPLHADMQNLPFEPDYFDLIWSEGAAYIIGFEAALKTWRPLLKEGGRIALTELCRFEGAPPSAEPGDIPGEVLQYWNTEYPAMTSREKNVELLEHAGYTLIDTFILPETAWWEEYYIPLQGRIAELEEKYHEDPEALEILSREADEIELYRRYSDYYGYVFFIAAKLSS